MFSGGFVTAVIAERDVTGRNRESVAIHMTGRNAVIAVNVQIAESARESKSRMSAGRWISMISKD